MTDIPIDANGPAYTRSETRNGVPLEYVSQKLSNAITSLHYLAKRNPALGEQLQAPMYYQLVAFLGLHNMLAATNDRNLTNRLLSGTTEELDRWIGLVIDQGDVLGVVDL